MKLFRNSLFSLAIFFISSCSSPKYFSDSSNLKTTYDIGYALSTKTHVGKLKNDELEALRIAFEKELSISIPKDKSILINYNQRADNCISMSDNGEDYVNAIKRGVEISSRICAEYNTLDFFVFAKDAFFTSYLNKKNWYNLDSGFFALNVFNDNKICEGFFILKPSGEFMKYYGEDYYSLVKDFLK